MLAPRAASAFVCIRCELKLARPRLPALSRRPSHANFSTSTRRRNTLDELDETPRPEPSKPAGKVTAHPLGKLRRRKGKAALRESTAQLAGVKTLGKDAEILVLQEVEDAPRPTDPPETAIPLPEGQNPSSVLAALQAEGVAVGQEEINQQLDSLRPRTHSNLDEPLYITLSVFRKLTKSLREGFTVQQLSRYFSIAKGIEQSLVRQQVLDDLKSAKATAKKPVERTPWYPGTTPLARRRPGADVPKGPKRKPLSKQLLVDQILRNAWKVVLLEEIEAPGEIELTLKPWQLSLLSTGATPTPLDRIGSMRKAKIEISWPTVLRITADKSSAEYAANDIECLLQTTEAKKFKLEPWLWLMDEDKVPKDRLVHIFPRNSLQTVGRLTGTVLQAVADHTVQIRGLDSSTTEEAYRALIRMLPMKQSGQRTVAGHGIDSKKERSYLLSSASKTSLDFRYRHLDLRRWTFPVSKLPSCDSTTGIIPNIATNGDERDPLNTDSIQDSLQKKVFEVVRSHSFTQASVNPITNWNSERVWYTEPDSNIAVNFGQILFPMSDHNTNALQLDLQHSHTCFSNAIPGLPKVLTGDAFEQTYRSPQRSLRYDFVPAAVERNKRGHSQTYPNLSIQVRFGADNKPMVHHVNLSFNDALHGVLLPDRATDIQFAMSKKIRMREPLNDPNIKAWSDAVCANIESGARLTAPSTLTVIVPRWTLTSPDVDTGRPRMIQYLFAGVRHRELFHTMFDEFAVSYIIDHQGKLGSKGASLSMYYSSGKKHPGPIVVSDPTRVKKFIKKAFEVADLVTEAAGGRALRTVAKPRDQLSDRKVRRQLPVGESDTPEQVDITEGVASGDLSDSTTDEAHSINAEAEDDLVASTRFDGATPGDNRDAASIDDTRPPKMLWEEDHVEGEEEEAEELEEKQHHTITDSHGESEDASHNNHTKTITLPA